MQSSKIHNCCPGWNYMQISNSLSNKNTRAMFIAGKCWNCFRQHASFITSLSEWILGPLKHHTCWSLQHTRQPAVLSYYRSTLNRRKSTTLWQFASDKSLSNLGTENSTAYYVRSTCCLSANLYFNTTWLPHVSLHDILMPMFCAVFQLSAYRQTSIMYCTTTKSRKT